jgi:hypothetical protein
MAMADKRELRREAKLRTIARGVFAVRCAVSGEVWVGAGDLNSSKTGTWFMLRNGMHYNKLMQAAWNSHGDSTFHFEVLASLEEDLSPLLVKDSLREGQKHWIKELGARPL